MVGEFAVGVLLAAASNDAGFNLFDTDAVTRLVEWTRPAIGAINTGGLAIFRTDETGRRAGYIRRADGAVPDGATPRTRQARVAEVAGGSADWVVPTFTVPVFIGIVATIARSTTIRVALTGFDADRTGPGVVHKEPLLRTVASVGTRLRACAAFVIWPGSECTVATSHPVFRLRKAD